MGVPSITYTLNRGLNTFIPAHSGEEIFNDSKVSFNKGYNKVTISYTASEALSRIECRCTFEGNEYGLGVGSLLYENFGSIPSTGDFTIDITPATFTWGDGLYRIGVHVRSLSTEEWNFTYFYLTKDSLNIIMQPQAQLANDITDLTGYTWFANNSLDVSTVASYNINFTDEIDDWTKLTTRNVDEQIQLVYLNSKVELVVYKASTGWVNDSHKIIEISGGSDAKNTTLITYMQNNGSLQSEVLKIRARGTVGTSIQQNNSQTAGVQQLPNVRQSGNTIGLF